MCSAYRPRARPPLQTQREADVQQLLAAQCHLGTKNCTASMERYVYRRARSARAACSSRAGPGGGRGGAAATCFAGCSDSGAPLGSGQRRREQREQGASRRERDPLRSSLPGLQPSPDLAACAFLRPPARVLRRRRRTDGIYVFNLAKTWEKLNLAARIIVAIENPQARPASRGSPAPPLYPVSGCR